MFLALGPHAVRNPFLLACENEMQMLSEHLSSFTSATSLQHVMPTYAHDKDARRCSS